MTISIPKTSGIYVIKCERNGKIYIGSSNNLRRRWNEHRHELNNNTHCNRYLQNAWNKYGKNCFKFSVLELCNVDDLVKREQHWLNVLRPFDKTIGFNLAIDAGASLRNYVFTEQHRRKIGDANKGKVVSQETRAKIGAIHKGKTVEITDEQRAKISAFHKGRKHTEEHIEKIAEKRRRKYIVTFPDNTEKLIVGLLRFCRDEGLDSVAMSRVARGIYSQHKGYKIRYVESTD